MQKKNVTYLKAKNVIILINKLENVEATKTETNFSILKIDYIKKVNIPV